MSNPGSLIQLHYHDNIKILEQLADNNGILYYRDAPVFPSVSKRENNGIVLESDGFYMSNLTMLNSTQYNLVSRFNYRDGNLMFDNVVISQSDSDIITDEEIQKAITDTLKILKEE